MYLNKGDQMLTTLGGIAMTLVMVVFAAVTFTVALVAQIWTLAVQVVSAVMPLFA
jgi:hypothetical protein